MDQILYVLNLLFCLKHEDINKAIIYKEGAIKFYQFLMKNLLMIFQ